MAAPGWKGYLKLSLVTCAVAMFPVATSRETIRLNTLNRKTGNRLRIRLIDEVTRAPVEEEDKVRGYEVAKGEHVMVEDEEIDAIALESKHTIDIQQFVPFEEIDPVYTGDRHYILPDDAVAEEAFAVIREGMRAKGMAGIGRVVLLRRERYLVLEPRGKGILATSLLYPYEIRPDEPVFGEMEGTAPDAKLLAQARKIVEAKRGPFKPANFTNDYQTALRKLVEAKQKGKPAKPTTSPPAEDTSPRVVNLFDALRRSVEAERKGKAPSKTTRSSASKGRAKAKSKGE